MAANHTIENFADFLDSQGKRDNPITVRGSRAYLRKWFKPAKRGGPLLAKGHELVLVKPTPDSPLEQAELVLP